MSPAFKQLTSQAVRFAHAARPRRRFIRGGGPAPEGSPLYMQKVFVLAFQRDVPGMSHIPIFPLIYTSRFKVESISSRRTPVVIVMHAA